VKGSGPVRALARAVFSRADLEREFRDELEFHLEARADALETSGLSRAAAERAARLEFGNPQRVKEECRDALGTRLVERTLQNIKVGFRSLRNSLSFTIAVVVTLGLRRSSVRSTPSCCSRSHTGRRIA
jgi:hypothetical protein